jgi:hypothetical protein
MGAHFFDNANLKIAAYARAIAGLHQCESLLPNQLCLKLQKWRMRPA